MNDYNGCREMTFGPVDQKSFLFCRTCGQSDHKWIWDIF